MKNAAKSKTLAGTVPSLFKTLAGLEALDAHHVHQVTLILRPDRQKRALPGLAELMLPARKRKTIERSEYFKDYGASGNDIQAVKSYCEAHHLRFLSSDKRDRTVRIEGDHSALNKSFGVELVQYLHKGTKIIGHQNEIRLPAELAQIVVGILGFNTTPFNSQFLGTSPLQPLKVIAAGIVYNDTGSDMIGETGAYGLSSDHWAALYNFPVQSKGKGVTIGIISLGGGYHESDMSTYFNNIKVPMPSITAVEVSARNDPGKNARADGEVATDIQTAGAAAPEAAIVVYFSENSPAGLFSAVSAAIKDTVNKPDILSISYGSPEHLNGNSNAEMSNIDALFQTAAFLNITIVVSSGDTGSTCDEDTLEIQFPASSPFVLTCGGTSATVSNDFKKITGEEVWKCNLSFRGQQLLMATGGGFSALFNTPPYQQGFLAGKKFETGKRGIPDISLHADPSRVGYYVRSGVDYIVGGTSASAPLLSALLARIHTASGSRGFMNPDLYRLRNLHPEAFNTITKGNNSVRDNIDDWHADEGSWDPCTGLGSINGAKLLAALKSSL